MSDFLNNLPDFNCFAAVLNMSITGGIVIISIIILRFFLRNLPKKYSYILWAAAAFRLCVPFSFSSAFSIFSIGRLAGSAPEVKNSAITYIPSDGEMLTSQVYIPAAQSAAQGGIALGDVLQLVWLLGAALLIIYAAAEYINLKIKLKNAVLISENIYRSDVIKTPFILGIIKPKIYIPFGTDDEYYEYIIAHEKYHIRRGDNIVKALAFLILCAHWFNPLCILAFYLMGRDMEMSCDEWVIEKFGKIKKPYSYALLSLAVKGGFPSPSPLCFGENSVKSRVKNILKFKKPKTFIAVTAAVVCLCLITACAANPTDVTQKLYAPISNDSISLAGGTEYCVGRVVYRAPTSSDSAIDGGNATVKIDGNDGSLVITKDETESAYAYVTGEKYTRDEFKTVLNKMDITTMGKENPIIDIMPDDDCIVADTYKNDGGKIAEVYSFGGYGGAQLFLNVNSTVIYEIMPSAGNMQKAVSSAVKSQVSFKESESKYTACAYAVYQKRYGKIDGTKDYNYVTVYAYCYGAAYTDKNGFIEETMAYSAPAAIELKADYASGSYTLSQIKLPLDGDEYDKSIKEMFPQEIYELYQSYGSNGEISRELRLAAVENLLSENEDLDIQGSIDYALKKLTAYSGDDLIMQPEYTALESYGKRTAAYFFNKARSGKLGEKEGKILADITAENATTENVESSGTGMEFYEKFSSKAEETYDSYVKNNGSAAGFESEFPYYYLCLGWKG